ncbi:MAG: Stp1/IreP family PP2C-type Ser/Thr phosphatase [Trueperaceae bacterium]
MVSTPKLKRSLTKVAYTGHSEAGRVRSINQDSYFVGEVETGYIAVVADGMGGHKTGEVASQKAVETIHQELSEASSHPPGALAKAVQVANLEIFDYANLHPEHQGMGTTLTTVFIDDQVGLVGHVGDSRAYLVRDSEIRQLTLDHSWVAEQVRQGVITQDEARRHRLRNVITNALGSTQEVKLDLLYFEVKKGDKLLLCSDGVSMLLTEDTLKTAVAQHDPETAVKFLIAEANRRGSPDNITAVVLEVQEVEVRSKKYAIPPNYQEPKSVTIGSGGTGIRKVEDAFPRQDWMAKLRRHPFYPYRIWLLGILYLVLVLIIFAWWQ